MRRAGSRLAIAGAALISATMLTGCVQNAATDGSSTRIAVSSDASVCEVAPGTAKAGTVVFTIKNTGDSVTEFYLYGADGATITGEVENIGPGVTRDLVVQVQAGDYVSACKPGGGDPVGSAPFTVTASGSADGAVALSPSVQAATDGYKDYVVQQATDLLAGTEAFAAAYAAGDLTAAKSLYAPTRVYWERIETVAESFGDLDPLLDLREADLEQGQVWTGWHAIEKDLWAEVAETGFTPYGSAKRASLAAQLVDDTRTLNARIGELEFSLDQLSNGAIGLLDEVATKKITGEEEAFSHTDLSDMQANVDGAEAIYTGLRDIVRENDAKLAETLDAEFAAIQAALGEHRVGDTFVSYTELTPAQIRTLSDRVNAVGEPLSRLTATVLL